MDDIEIDHLDEELPTVWVVTRDQIIELFSEDQQYQTLEIDQPKPLIARLFIRYARLIERLDRCCNDESQAQKNLAMRRLLDSALVRMLELKAELVDLHMSEVQYIDEELIQTKTIPPNLELTPLAMFPLKRSEQLQDFTERLYQGERIFVEEQEMSDEELEEEELTEEMKMRKKKPVRPMGKQLDPKQEAISQAIRLIQRHERARQYRLEFLDEKTMYDLRQNYEQPQAVPKEIADACAIKIQSIWRGYQVRKTMRVQDDRRKLLIRMEIPSWKSPEIHEKDKETFALKRERREQRLKELAETNVSEKSRLMRVVGPRLIEDIGDEIRWWFQNWYDVAKAFDKYPPENKGGTIIVIRGETLTPEEYREKQEQKRREKELLKDNPLLAKKLKAEEDKKKKQEEERLKKEKEQKEKEKKAAKRKKKKKKDSDEPEKWIFKVSEALQQLDDVNKQFDIDWTQLDQETVVKDNLLVEKITDDKCYEVQLEMRKIVDEMMRIELEMLQTAHARDRHKKPPKKKKKRRHKGKKKGKKDPTRRRAIEDLFQTLYDQGIIRKYPATDFTEFVGDYSYRNMEMLARNVNPLACVGDVRRAIINNCILPLSGENLPKPKSVCICGPRESGKEFIVYGICTSVDAILFDLSPSVLLGKYPGKEGLKMLLHLVNKMSRILQPSVIFIDGAEKTFYKKIPKPEIVQDPTRLRKKLFKGIVKPIQPSDRVMVIGVSEQPWVCKVRPFVKAYERFIMIPRTDCNTVYQLWTEILMKYHGVERNINLTALAMLTDGYPIAYIRKMTKHIMIPDRIIRFQFEPLQQHELLEALLYGGTEPVSLEEQDKFTAWYNKKVKLGRALTKDLRKKEEARLADEKMAEKEKKDKEKEKEKAKMIKK